MNKNNAWQKNPCVNEPKRAILGIQFNYILYYFKYKIKIQNSKKALCPSGIASILLGFLVVHLTINGNLIWWNTE